jgi:hypothetical protein
MHSILEAIHRGEPNAMLAALQAGADPNERDAKGRTPVMLAVKRENRVAVRLLVEFGASLDVEDLRGRTPLFDARNRPMTEFLLELGANPDFGRLGGMTIAAFFTSFGERDLVDLFLRYGADPGEKLRGGQTIQDALDSEGSEWRLSSGPPERRQHHLESVLAFSENLQLTPEQFVSRNYQLILWGYGSMTFDDPAVMVWARKVGEILQSFERTESACRQHLESETLARALVYLGRAGRKAERVAAKQARWSDFETAYWTSAP